MTTRRHAILAVDDSPTNLHALTDYLSGFDFDILAAADGEAALETCRRAAPDVVLLDVILPGIDGFETCRRLKAAEDTKDIPVIFMTSLNRSADKVKGFEAGAVDYVTKPFEPRELMARLTAHLRIRDLTRDLRAMNQDLAARTEELGRTLHRLKAAQAQLIESEKMAALGALVAGVAHEINTPVGVCITAASTLERECGLLAAACRSGRLKRAVLEGHLETLGQGNRLLTSNLRRAADLIESFKQTAADQTSLQKRRFSVKKCIDDTVLSLGPRLKPPGHAVEIEGEDDLVLCSFPGALSQIAANLVMNSIVHAYPDNGPGTLRFRISPTPEGARVTYSDDGRGIPPDCVGKIFDPFFTTAGNGRGSGLGLHIVYNLTVRKLRGTIRCEGRPGRGAAFILTLPDQPEGGTGP